MQYIVGSVVILCAALLGLALLRLRQPGLNEAHAGADAELPSPYEGLPAWDSPRVELQLKPARSRPQCLKDSKPSPATAAALLAVIRDLQKARVESFEVIWPALNPDSNRHTRDLLINLRAGKY